MKKASDKLAFFITTNENLVLRQNPGNSIRKFCIT